MSLNDSQNPAQDSGKPQRKRRIRTWTIIQWFLIPILLVGALAGGLVTGYVVLGHREFSDVLQFSTWKHVYDLVFAP
ncbi:DNA-directed RNA polymerase subunit beta [Paenibacillus sp. NFR01]|uniref:DNA-directed RNA polymerase subunit beta n=1 Tax=Paenibacillus sp. NFR01 TaxID=1566279 RepID=UPI0008AFD4FA|nr:DNA-directed RNA polymerase subunit beta [Paenibacillus sp. NFR01]SEU13853.1 DNA-directed RNA polymerase subunit beta [Paenibacillus sp. NFR01]